ncbi:MAG: J domain-containing protein [Myxococcota bacterium]
MIRLFLLAALFYVVWRALTQERPKRSFSTAAQDPVATPSAWEVLGVAPGSSSEEIRRAYQDKIRQYHPDRVNDPGEELQALADSKTKAINAAYETLKQRARR